MTQNTTNLSTQTIGLDLGDKRSVAIVLAPGGEILEELKLQMTRASLDSAFGSRPSCRIALEVGTHSAWIAEQLSGSVHRPTSGLPLRIILRRLSFIGESAEAQRETIAAWPSAQRRSGGPLRVIPPILALPAEDLTVGTSPRTLQ
jgi:hypothetical protein